MSGHLPYPVLPPYAVRPLLFRWRITLTEMCYLYVRYMIVMTSLLVVMLVSGWDQHAGLNPETHPYDHHYDPHYHHDQHAGFNHHTSGLNPETSMRVSTMRPACWSQPCSCWSQPFSCWSQPWDQHVGINPQWRSKLMVKHLRNDDQKPQKWCWNFNCHQKPL